MLKRARATVMLTVPICLAPLAIGSVWGAGAAAAVTPTYGATWVAEPSTNTLAEFAPGAHGAAAPIATIAGIHTGLASPSGIAVSTTGAIYVSNAGNDSITEYSAGSTGDVKPVKTIQGPATGLAAPSSITLYNHAVWVTNPSTNVVETFTAGSGGNELPATSISGTKTRLDHPVALAIDPDAASFDDLDGLGGPSLGFPGLAVINAPTSGAGYVTGFSSSLFGDVAPLTLIRSSAKHRMLSPTAIVNDGFGLFLVTDGGSNSISAINESPFPGLVDNTQKILKDPITGPTTALDAPSGITHNALGQLVVTNGGDHAVRTYAAGAHGDAAPIHTLTAPGAGIGDPSALQVSASRPGAPTDEHVVLHRSALTKGVRATISWRPPAQTGGGLIGYEVLLLGSPNRTTETHIKAKGSELIGPGGEFLKIAATKSTRITAVLPRGHDYLFDVAAINEVGGTAAAPIERSLTTASDAPQRVRATSETHAIAVHWTAPKIDGGYPITGYRIEYGTCPPEAKGCASHSKVVSRRSTYTMIRGLHSNTKYFVRVFARTHQGLGKASRIARTRTLL